MSANGIVTDAGRAFKARLLASDPSLVVGGQIRGLLWYALGSGNWADLQSPPAEDPAQTGLRSELCRKLIARSAYLQQDDATGTITYKNRKYKEVTGPTAIVAYFASFLEDEANGFPIVEEAVFGGVVTTLASPFALADQVTVPGVCYWVRNRPIYSKGSADQYQVVPIFEEP